MGGDAIFASLLACLVEGNEETDIEMNGMEMANSLGDSESTAFIVGLVVDRMKKKNGLIREQQKKMQELELQLQALGQPSLRQKIQEMELQLQKLKLQPHQQPSVQPHQQPIMQPPQQTPVLPPRQLLQKTNELLLKLKSQRQKFEKMRPSQKCQQQQPRIRLPNSQCLLRLHLQKLTALHLHMQRQLRYQAE